MPLAEMGVSVLDCEHKTPPAASSGFPYIAIPEIQDGRVMVSQSRLISEEHLIEWTRRTTPRAGDIVVTRRGRVGDTAPIPSGLRCAIGQNLVLLRSNGLRVDQAYLRWAVRSPQWWAEVDRLMNVGAVFSSLNVKDIARIRLDFPQLRDQQAIAAVLGALDDKIASNLALIAKAREYALLISRVHAPMTRLGNVVIHQSRQVQPANMSEEEVDLFSLPRFDSGVGAERVHPSEIKSGKFLIEGSVVLVSKLNPRIPRIWPIDEDGSVVPKFASTEFLVLEPFTCTPDVLWALLSQPEFTSALEGQVAGTSGSHQRVRPADLLSTRIPDPRLISPQLHEDINGVLAPVRALLRENRTLAATRDALLPQLMSSKLRVRDAERIPAEAGA
ncbi:restriction endonuclease subunit S [Microbacterium sp.]|uniref:restriction endonuclease subunit S n=1 Tax=Microbacterium sp. TaxID=51671 RepID=UPI003C1813AB